MRRNTTRPRKYITRIFEVLLFTVIAFSVTAVPGAFESAPLLAAPTPVDTQFTLRENYIPYDTFRRLTRDNPNGIIMGLKEYRSLVEQAVATSAQQPQPLPPFEATVRSAEYIGRGDNDGVVAVTAAIDIHAPRLGWNICPLGALPDNVGRVLVDGQPGWLLVGPHPTRGGSDQGLLLVQGQGRHHVQLEFTIPTRDSGDSTRFETRLLDTTAARLRLEIPGSAEARCSLPSMLRTDGESNTGEATTIFEVPLGTAKQVTLDWQRRQASVENPPLLRAQHEISYRPRPTHSSFLWRVAVTVSRRGVGELRFREPTGCRVLEASGELLQRWERVDGELRVTLSERTPGTLLFDFAGSLDLEADNFRLAAPRLIGAYRDAGLLGVSEFVGGPDSYTLVLDQTQGVDEWSRDAANLTTPEGAPIRYLFSFANAADSTAAQVVGRITPIELTYDNRSTLLLRVHERESVLTGHCRLTVDHGRLYQGMWRIPAGWNLRTLEEVSLSSAIRGVQWQVTDDATRVRIVVTRAIDPNHPLEFNFQLQRQRPQLDSAVDFAVPYFEGARRQQIDVGLALFSGLVLESAQLDGWRSLAPEELTRLGLALRADDTQKLVWTAAVTTRTDAPIATPADAPRVRLSPAPRQPRGEVRIVTHVLAAERTRNAANAANAIDGSPRNTLRVRGDFMIAVADRGIESLTIEHPPLDPEINVWVVGDGVKEVVPVTEADGGQRLVARQVSFNAPWLGSKQLRVEYELPVTPGQPVAIPLLRLRGDFGEERFVVLQSQGSVEVEENPGVALHSAPLEEVPDFAVPWQNARLLEAYRMQNGSDATGTVNTVLHDRAPLLTFLIQELKLITLLGREGRARTEAEALLTYGEEQWLRLRLPDSSRCLSVTIDGEQVHAVRNEGINSEILVIPLPPRTFARINIAYESTQDQVLGDWGSVELHGPEFLDVPVSETQWWLHHREGYRFYVTGGNVRSVRPHEELRDSGFFDALSNALERGDWPGLSAWHPHAPKRRKVGPTAIRLAPQFTVTSQEKQGRLTSVQQQNTAASQHAPLFTMIPEGRVLELRKFGGSPRLVLSYQTFHWWSFATQGMFLLAALIALQVWWLKGLRLFWLFIVGGLIAGTTIPVALDHESPLLAIPACEGLLVTALGVALFVGLRRLATRIRQRREDRRQRRLGYASLLLAVGVGCGVATVTENAHAQIDPFDGVLIPFDPDRAQLDESDPDAKVFIPDEQFRLLSKLAHPNVEADRDPQWEVLDVKTPIIIGSSDYQLRVMEDRFEISGRVELFCTSSEWQQLPLPFAATQLTRVTLDGESVGFAQGNQQAQIALHGRGRHQLQLVITGRVYNDLGLHHVRSHLLKGARATVRAELPAGAVVDRPQSSSGLNRVASADSDTPAWQVRLGLEPELHIAWTFPKVEGSISSQVESVSYTHLRLGVHEMSVDRHEHLRITGRGIDDAAYDILGAWEVTQVLGPEVNEWSVIAGDADNPPQLRIFFKRPVQAFRGRIRGVARATDSLALPSLQLRDGIRQESYFGVQHGVRRRFSPSLLANATRTQMESVLQVVPHSSSAQETPDRVYKLFGSGAGESIEIVPAPQKLELSTQGVALIAGPINKFFLATRFADVQLGGSRYSIRVPQDWTVREVLAEQLRSWEVVEGADHRQLNIEFLQHPTAGNNVIWSAEASSANPVQLPALNVVGASGEIIEHHMQWTLAADEELELTVDDPRQWSELPLSAAGTWLQLPSTASYRAAYQSRRATTALSVAQRIRPSRMTATVVNLVRTTDEYFQVNARIRARVHFQGRDRFEIILPRGSLPLFAETTNQRSRRILTPEPGVTRVEFVLQSPVRGDQDIDLIYRIARNTPSANAPRELVTPLQLLDGSTPLQAVQEFVAIVHTGRALSLTPQVVGLEPHEREAFPFLPEGVSERSIHSTFRAATRDWSLTLSEQAVVVTREYDAIIRLADLSTRVGVDGTLRTEVTYSLTNLSLQFLALQLPLGAELWGVTVNGDPVAVAQSNNGGRSELRIPVERMSETDLSHEIVILYQEPSLQLPAWRTARKLEGPRISSQRIVVRDAVWSVHFPQEYELSEDLQTMRETPPTERQAKKLSSLLEQQEAVLSAAQGAGSKRTRERAKQGLARLEQALGDSLAELRDTRQQEVTQRGQLSEDELDRNWAKNARILEEAQQIQQQVQGRLNAPDQDSGYNRDQEAFRDRTLLLEGNLWRHGTTFADSQQATREQRGLHPQQLLDRNRYLGAHLLATPNLDTGVLEVVPVAPTDTQGLSPLPAAGRSGTSPRLDMNAGEEGIVTAAYHSGTGVAELELTLTQRSSKGRLGAWIVLVALTALSITLFVRRRR